MSHQQDSLKYDGSPNSKIIQTFISFYSRIDTQHTLQNRLIDLFFIAHTLALILLIPSSHQTNMFRSFCTFPLTTFPIKTPLLKAFLSVMSVRLVKFFLYSRHLFTCLNFGRTSIFIKLNNLFGQSCLSHFIRAI